MKKLLLCLVMTLSVVSVFGQRRMHLRDVYVNLDTLVIEVASVPAESDVLIELPKESKIILAFNVGRTKAIVLHNPGYQFVRRLEYDVRETETRIILYHKDKYLYCGYVYDKKVKAARYFEAINENEKARLTKRLPFLSRIPSFSEE